MAPPQGWWSCQSGSWQRSAFLRAASRPGARCSPSGCCSRTGCVRPPAASQQRWDAAGQVECPPCPAEHMYDHEVESMHCKKFENYLDLCLHILYGVRRLHLQSDGLPSQGFHKDLHPYHLLIDWCIWYEQSLWTVRERTVQSWMYFYATIICLFLHVWTCNDMSPIWTLRVVFQNSLQGFLLECKRKEESGIRWQGGSENPKMVNVLIQYSKCEKQESNYLSIGFHKGTKFKGFWF